MTINEIIEKSKQGGAELTETEQAILYAYWIGLEAGTKNISDAYRERLEAVNERFAGMRYGKQARRVLADNFNDGTWIYSSNYAQDSAEAFGNTEI